MFKNKLVLALPLIALGIIFIFSLTLFPTVQPEPENLPIAIVNEDEGIEIPNQPAMNMGLTFVEKIQESTEASDGEEPLVKWIEVGSNDEVQEGMNNQKYYGALVIPKDLSEKQASLQTPEPSTPELQIFINQGMNMPASTMVREVLNGVVDNMNNNVRQQMLDAFEEQDEKLTIQQADILTEPII